MGALGRGWGLTWGSSAERQHPHLVSIRLKAQRDSQTLLTPSYAIDALQLASQLKGQYANWAALKTQRIKASPEGSLGWDTLLTEIFREAVTHEHTPRKTRLF